MTAVTSGEVPLPSDERIPRSAQSQQGSAFDTTGHGDLNMNIPLEPFLKNTQDSRKVQEIVTRLESGHQPAPSPDEDHADAVVDAENADPQSPRKPLPARWTGKMHGPSLATAQRAMARESRKQSSTTFLTKTSVEAVESDLTATNTLRRTNSTMGRSGGSPVRGSPKRDSTLQSTVSPKRPAWGSVHKVENLKVDDSRKHRHAPSSVSTVGGFVTARQSPVSQPGSPHSFKTAPVELRDDVSELDLANTDDDVQKTTSRSIGTKPHSRGKSEPQAKVSPLGRATMTKPSAPTLSLRIPNTSSQSTDISPLTAGSATSSGTGTPASPTSSSRIPRVSSSVKGESSQLTRSRSTKSLPSKSTAVKGSRRRETENKQPLDLIEPASIPLPKTPIAATLRHVRTLNSEGSTPILSCRDKAGVTHDVLTTSNLSQLDKQPAVAAPLADHTPAKTESVGSTSWPDTIVEGPPSVHSTEEIGMEHPSDAVHIPSFDGPADVKDNWHTASDHASDETIETKEARCRLQRVASWASETTIKAVQRDPVLEDTAVLYSRRKSDSAGVDASTTPVEAAAPPPEPVSATHPDTEPNTSSAPGGGKLLQSNVHSRPKTPSESSLLSSLTSGLRPEAAEFVPQRRTAMEYPATMPPPQSAMSYRPPVPTEWMNPQETQQFPALEAPNVPFDPFGLDAYGRPLYHLMYPVPIGPGTPYDLSKYRTFNRSPKKAKKKRYDGTSKRERKSRDGGTDGSPNKGGPTENGHTENHTSAVTEDEKTPRPTPAVPARSTSPFHVENFATSISQVDDSQDPFRSQLEEIRDQAAALHLNGNAIVDQAKGDMSRSETVGCASRILVPQDPPFRPQYPSFEAPRPRGPRDDRSYDEGYSGPAFTQIQSDFNSLPSSYQGYGYNRHRYSNSRSDLYPSHGNGLYEGRGPRSFRNRKWNASAGVPLETIEATAPFPNPVAPPGPQRTVEPVQTGPNGEATGHSKEYVGYTIDKPRHERKTCGQMIIEPSMEWHGQVCNKCDDKH